MILGQILSIALQTYSFLRTPNNLYSLYLSILYKNSLHIILQNESDEEMKEYWDFRIRETKEEIRTLCLKQMSYLLFSIAGIFGIITFFSKER